MNSYLKRPNFSFAFGPRTWAGGAGTAGATVLLWRAPEACEVTAAWAVNNGTAIAAGATDYITMTLINGGTAGTALTALCATTGGTAGGDVAGWARRTPIAFSLGGTAKLAQGEWLGVKAIGYGGSLISDFAVHFDVTLASYSD